MVTPDGLSRNRCTPPTTSRARKYRLVEAIAQNEVAKCELVGTFSTAPKRGLQAVGSKNSKPIRTTKTLPIAKTRYVSADHSKVFIEVSESRGLVVADIHPGPITSNSYAAVEACAQGAVTNTALSEELISVIPPETLGT